MLWRILKIIAGEQAGKKNKSTSDRFSLEFCKIDAKISPDIDCLLQYVSSDEIIFKSGTNIEESTETTLQITYYPLKTRKSQHSVDIETVVRILKKGQLAQDKFLYKAQYNNKNEPGLKKFFLYLKEVEATQLEKLVDYHDRREHFRVNRVLPVFSKNIRSYKCLTKNISTGGIMLACTGGVKKGDVISLRLELDDYHAAPLQMDGEVCWIEDSTPNQMYVGIKFLDLSEEEMKALREYIGSIKKKIR